MKRYSVILFAPALLLLVAGLAQAELKEVSFRNTKDGALKLYCQKIGGRIKTSILCNKQPFIPDAAWEEINAKKVCFQHDDGRIRACDELSRTDKNLMLGV